MFAQQPKQTLLYNLFDAAQSAQNPMAVIGLTCRLDALDLLEKRVKSRFSHRQIYLFSTTNFDGFMEMAKDTFIIPEHIHGYKEFNASVEELFKTPVMIGIVRKIYDISKDIRLFHKIAVKKKCSLYEDVVNIIYSIVLSSNKAIHSTSLISRRFYRI